MVLKLYLPLANLCVFYNLLAQSIMDGSQLYKTHLFNALWRSMILAIEASPIQCSAITYNGSDHICNYIFFLKCLFSVHVKDFHKAGLTTEIFFSCVSYRHYCMVLFAAIPSKCVSERNTIGGEKGQHLSPVAL